MNRNNKWILAAIPFISLLAIESCYAQSFYKWTDDKGSTHYTQTPPPKKVATKVAINTHVPQDSDSEIKNLKDQSTINAKAASANDELAEKKRQDAAADAERRNKNSVACQEIKNNIAQLQSGRRLRTTDASGERNYLTEDQKAQQLIDQSTQVKNDCP